MFPQLDSIVAMGKAETITAGASSSYRVRVDGKDLFYKIINRRPLSLLKSVERPLSAHVLPLIPSLSAVDFRSTKHAEKEHRTVNKWAQAGLTVIVPEEYDNNSIVYPYVEKRDVSSYLHEDPSFSLDGLLGVMAKTRSLAFSHRDSDYFHSDPHLKNFLYDEEHEEVIPIDPGRVFRKDKSLEEIDTSNSMLFLYSFFHLDLPRSTIAGYLEKAVESFEPEARDRLREANGTEVSLVSTAYLAFRELVVSAVKGHPVRSLGMNNYQYTHRNRKLVDDILSS